MFSVKYMLSSNPVDESPLRTLVGSSNGNYLYRNNYCLPLGYMMSEKAIKGWESSMLDRIGSPEFPGTAAGSKRRHALSGNLYTVAGSRGYDN